MSTSTSKLGYCQQIVHSTPPVSLFHRGFSTQFPRSFRAVSAAEIPRSKQSSLVPSHSQSLVLVHGTSILVNIRA